jgi:hypothetical protein
VLGGRSNRQRDDVFATGDILLSPHFSFTASLMSTCAVAPPGSLQKTVAVCYACKSVGLCLSEVLELYDALCSAVCNKVLTRV